MTGPALLLALAAAALLDLQGAPQASVREEIVVVAERRAVPREEAPAAVTVLDREEIAARPAATLADLLDAVPGIFVPGAAEHGGAPMPSARGFFGGGEAEYLQLRVDGVPLADAESGVADWRRLRAADLERVEVLRGPGSALYGDTALGGVVEVVTRHAGGGEPGGWLALAGGSFDTGAVDLGWRRGTAAPRTDRAAGPPSPLSSRAKPRDLGGGSLDHAESAPGAWAVGLAAGAFRTDGYREHGAGERWSADLSLARETAAGLLRFTAAAEERDREEPGPLPLAELRRDPDRSDPLFRFDRETVDRQRLAVRFERARGVWPFRAGAWVGRRSSDQLRTLLVAAGLGDRAWRGIDSAVLGTTAEVESGHLLGEAHLRAGWEGTRERLDTSYREVSPAGSIGARRAAIDGRRDRLALFTTAGLPLGDRVRLAAGLRWDRIKEAFAGAADRRDHEAWSPRLGVTYRLGVAAAPVVAFVQLARAFKAPTVDQLFDPRPFPDFAGGTFTISNPALSPQRAGSFEAGLGQAGATGRWDLAAYRIDVEDEIDFDPATFRYVNLGESRHTGVEASASWRPGASWSPALAYAWTQVEPARGPNRGRQLKNVPEHRARLAVDWSPARRPHGGPGAGFHLAAAWTWTAGRFFDDANRLPMADASVLDLRVEKPLGRARLYLDLLNALDQRWEEVGYVLPDLATGAGVPHALPAPGRSVRVGWDWDW